MPGPNDDDSTGDRRSNDRRLTVQPFSSEDRRKGDRRSSEDRRSAPRQ